MPGCAFCQSIIASKFDVGFPFSSFSNMIFGAHKSECTMDGGKPKRSHEEGSRSDFPLFRQVQKFSLPTAVPNVQKVETTQKLDKTLSCISC